MKKLTDKKKKISIVILFIIIIVISIFFANKENIKEIKKLDTSVLNNRTDELVFSFSIDDFIESYNNLYVKDKKKTYLTSSSIWTCLVHENSIHSNHETYDYYFTENESNQTLPIIEVYVPSNNDYVQEIVINFDYHSYMEKNYNLYEEMCFYTLKSLLNETNDKEIIKLYKNINQLAEDNIFSSEEWYKNGAVPRVIYYRNGVGVYPYFAIGQHMKLCVIPVTEQTISEFKQKGVDIYKF